MSNPTRQHYIPRVYLKNFTNENDKVWVYDKHEQSLKELSTKDTTLEKNLYTITDTEGNKDFSIEKSFSEVESATGPIISKVIKQETITLKEKAQLSLFIALLENRTVLALEENNKTSSEILTWAKNMRLYNGDFDHIIEKMGCSREEAIEKIKNAKVSFNKATNLTTLIDIANTIAQNYSMMEWRMFYAKNSNFLTSDNPLFLLPEKIDNNYGYGILTPGVNKIIPISSKTLLCIGDIGIIAVHGLNMGDKQRIRQLNILTYLNAKRFVIANNKGLIENIVKRVESKIL